MKLLVKPFFISTILLIFLIGFSMSGFSQKWKHHMSQWVTYAEFGSILAYTTGTVTVEGKLFSSQADKFHVYGRLGIGGLHEFFVDPSGPGGKLGITMFTGKEAHHIEMELGIFVGWNTQNDGSAFTWPVAGLGYRYQPPTSGLLFKAFANVSGVGVGLGYAWQ